MSLTSAPFGFRPSWNKIGLERANRYNIAGAYATALFKGQPVVLNTNGTIVTAAATGAIKGILAGVEFTDASGKPNLQPNWPAGQTILAGTEAYAYVWDDPSNVYEVQASGPVPQTAVGDQGNVINVANGSTATGLSACGLNATLSGAGVQGQFRIIGFGKQPDNVAGDAFTVVQVQIANDQFLNPQTAI